MADRRNHESEDLRDYEILDESDALDDSPVADPLDQGVVAPVHRSAGMRYALSGEEDNESLDERLDEEEPDDTADAVGEAADENATEEDLARFEASDEPDPRAGRLTETDEDTDPATRDELTAHDPGVAGGAATGEEAAIHVMDED